MAKGISSIISFSVIQSQHFKNIDLVYCFIHSQVSALTFFYHRLVQEQVLTDGMTGKVAFDSHGDRTNAEYTLMNVQEQREEQDGQQGPASKILMPVGEFLYDKVR